MRKTTEKRVELLDAKIQEMELALSVLKKIRDDPDIGEKRVVEEAGIDYAVYRRIVFDANWMKKKTNSVPDMDVLNKEFREYVPTVSWREMLWCDVVGEDPNNIHLAPLDVSETIDMILDDIAKVSRGGEKIRDVLVYYYKDGLNKTEIGKLYDLTNNRIAQIIAKGLRLMRSRGKWITYGKKFCVNSMMIEKKLMEDCEIRIRREVLNQINANIPPIRDLVVKGVELINLQEATSDKKKLVEMATPIENLDLSVRSYNCLKRAGYNTLHDIIIATEESDEKLLRVRNLGRKSVLEITSMLYEFGYRETPGLRH